MTDYMIKIEEKNVVCPKCGQVSIDILALSALTCIFMCRLCKNSYGVKWLSESDIEKVKKTAEYRKRHPPEDEKITEQGVTIKKKPWLRI